MLCGGLFKSFSCIKDTILIPNQPFKTSKAFFKKPPKPPDFRGPKVLLYYALLIFPAAFIFNAYAEFEHYKYLKAQQRKACHRSALEAITMPHNLKELCRMEYRPITVTGKFNHEKEMYIGPKYLIVAQTSLHSSCKTFCKDHAHVGYQVVTPFQLTDRESPITILVNRGWVPSKNLDPCTRPAGQIKSEVTLTGILRKSERQPLFYFNLFDDDNVYRYRDVEEMARNANTSTIYIELVDRSTVKGGPICGQTSFGSPLAHKLEAYKFGGLGLMALLLWIHLYKTH